MIMLNVLLIAICASTSTARSLSQESSFVLSQGSSETNFIQIDPANVGLTNELGSNNFFASPGFAFAESFLLTAVTSQGNDTFNQTTEGDQQTRANSGVSSFDASSRNNVTAFAVLPNSNSFANITSYTQQETRAQASNETVGSAITRGRFASFGLQLTGEGLDISADSNSDVTLQVAGFSLNTEADVNGFTDVDGPTARTVDLGDTAAIVNPQLVASECSGQNIGQVVDGRISQGSNCVLTSTFGS